MSQLYPSADRYITLSSGANHVESNREQPEYFQSVVNMQTDRLLQKVIRILQGDIREIGVTDEWKGFLASLTEYEKHELFTQVTHSINSSYWLFDTMAATLDNLPSPVEAIAYDFDVQEIPDTILSALEFRVRDIAFEALGTTRLQHYRDVMEAIRTQAKPLRLGQNKTVLAFQGNTIVFQQPISIHGALGIQGETQDEIRSLLNTDSTATA